MYLKRLELNGFKSFAKRTVLKFQTPITAVVGPNGSGKSNVAEAIQWVLGEQSLKSLRGKKGEDFIFTGSPTSSRLGRASAAIVFDNRGEKFGDINFKEVIIERRVYRDGVNEYFLNGSKVRLKDIIEILARVGLGTSRHHIISQGEADRILYASAAEKREMIEDALGIRIFQLKRKEAERKLEQTEENTKQVSSLRREIQPHLKFLGLQADKIKKAEEIRQELEKKLRDYLRRENSCLLAQAEEINLKKEIPQKNLFKKEKEIKILKEKIKKEEAFGVNSQQEENNKLLKIKSEMEKAREEIRRREREMGRLEGIIEFKKNQKTEKESSAIPAEEIKDFFEKLKNKLTETLSSDNPGKIKESIKEILRIIGSFFDKFSSAKKDFSDLKELEEKMAKIGKDLFSFKKDEEERQKLFNQTSSEIQDSFKNLREMEREIYRLESESSRIKDDWRGFDLAEEKLRLRQSEFEKEKKEAEILFGKIDLEKNAEFEEDFSDVLREKLKREIERMKIRSEEAGGMDFSVLKEFEETKKRDEFLAKELKDLEDSGQNLKKIIKDLEIKLEEDFKIGIEKINKEFQKHFETMFGGGRAGLKLIKLQRLRKEDDLKISPETIPNEDAEMGVEISIDLPRKRVKSLEMLSGGERALSSIALLFALSAVNPPPFLVLDETDAALDEANSRRYAAMLKELSQNTQLVVITHNRETMRSAGVLYGVTMGRDSISCLLSIQLEKAEKISLESYSNAVK
ncbi:MAG: AAA family ATPase [Candidatus Niyogibacteria bacterium]|nr:AAA family ATPase [Candidatus Niyogibacteria bacterium]